MLVSLLFSNYTFLSHPSSKLLALKNLSEGLLLENGKLRYLSTNASGEAMLVKQKQEINVQAETWIERHRDIAHLCGIT